MRCRALAFCSGATAAAMKSGRPARWNAIARSIQTTRVKIVDVALLPRFRLCRGSLSWNIGGSASGSFFAAAVAFARTLPKKPDAFARASFGRRRSKLSLRSLGVSVAQALATLPRKPPGSEPPRLSEPRLSEPPSPLPLELAGALLKDAGTIAMSSSCASTIRLLDISVQGGESRLDARLG